MGGVHSNIVVHRVIVALVKHDMLAIVCKTMPGLKNSRSLANGNNARVSRGVRGGRGS